MAGMFGAGVDPKIGFLLPFMQGAGDASMVQNMMGGGGIQPSFNYNSAGQIVSAGMPGMPSSGGSGVFGAYGGSGGGLFGGGMGDLVNQQRQANLDTRNYNRGLWGEVSGYARGVPQRFGADPLNQGARNLSAGLLANPEAIDDRVQQRMINRASNLTNAAANANRAGARQGLMQRGVLGGTQQRTAMDRIERGRTAALTGLASDIEAQRALRRNEDIRNAAGLGSSLAGQQAGFDQAASQTLMSGVPYEAPDDLSGLAALMASGGMFGGGGGGGLQFGSMNLGYNRNRNSAPSVGFAGNWTAPQQEGPFVSQYGTYNNNYQPRTGGFGTGRSVYSDANSGAAYGMGPLFGNMYQGEQNAAPLAPNFGMVNNPNLGYDFALQAALNPGAGGAEINQRMFPAMF